MKAHSKTTYIVISIILAFFFSNSWAQSAQSSLEDPQLAEAFKRISDRLVCQCGCNLILRVCNHENCPSATPMRKKIEEELLEGASEEQIVQDFVREYGVVILSEPPRKGINLAAWVMPGFAVLVGLFLIIYLILSWVAKRRLKTADRPTEIDREIKTQIEEDLKKMGG